MNHGATMGVWGQGHGGGVEQTAAEVGGELHVVVRRARRIRTGVKAGHSGHSATHAICELGSAR